MKFLIFTIGLLIGLALAFYWLSQLGPIVGLNANGQ